MNHNDQSSVDSFQIRMQIRTVKGSLFVHIVIRVLNIIINNWNVLKKESCPGI